MKPQYARRGPRRGQRGGPSRSNGYSRPAPKPEKPSFFARLLGMFGLSKPKTSKATAKPSTPSAPYTPVTSKLSRKPELVEVTSERLYVGNLSYDATESDLFELFNGVGSVRNAEVVAHKHSQRSKGFAFVEMASIDEAKRAVSELHDKEFMGRKLVVSGAKSVGVN